MKHERLGKYIILGELGAGGFATVLRAQDTILGREVALKILSPLLMREASWVDTFYKEARAVACLEHPGIVTIYEIDEIDGRIFIAMQLVAGPNLEQYLRYRSRLSWDEACHIFNKVGEALRYAHEQNILHRDLKPNNILMNQARSSIILSDFGLAQVVSKNSYSTVLSGGIVGTPQYIAPEVWEGEPARPQTDIYALGCVLYELLTGNPLFQGKSVASIMRQHFKPLSLPAQWPDGVPDTINGWFSKSLAQNPANRYLTVTEMLEALPTTAAKPLRLPPEATDPAARYLKDQPDYSPSTGTDTPLIGWRPLGLDDSET